MRYTITITDSHFEELKNYFLNDTKEKAAYIIFGRSVIKNDLWTGEPEERFLSKDIIYIPEEDIIESTDNKISWNTNSFISCLKKVENENSILALIHNHPKDCNDFSIIDNENEANLFKMAFNRNGSNKPFLSIIITPDENILARVWTPTLKPSKVDLIRVLGKNFKFIYSEKYQNADLEIFHRQQLAFGSALNKDLSLLRIGIIGCGATGSATAMLLARLGVGKILLVDKDIVERSNLNRLHGASVIDCDACKPKVEIIGQSITSMGLGAKVKYIQDWVTSQTCRDAIKSCDIIFGCTDDHEGRAFLNRLSYFYLIPVIDMGLMIKLTEEEPIEIQCLDGRVSVIFPNNVCLSCKGIINPQRIRDDNLKRNNPLEYNALKQEAYVVGEGNPSPAVVTFTTEVATMAVNELLHRIQGFRGKDGHCNERKRFFHKQAEDLRIRNKPREGCIICNNKKYWGMGDVEPFLDRA